MQAVIQKLELKKILNRYYFRIEMLDENGVKRSLDNPFLSDDINFRKQVFGILSACGNFDLMRLATSNPKPSKMIGYYQEGYRIFENENKEWFNINRETGLCTCKRPNRRTRKAFDLLTKQNRFNIYKTEGVIERIASQSGTFQILFTCELGSACFYTGKIYYGFGYPLTTEFDTNPSDVALSAKMFTSFIISLMKLYGINDLLKFGGNIDSLPVVEIELNNNKITTITNPTTGMGFAIGTEYEIVNIFELQEQLKKQSYGKS